MTGFEVLLRFLHLGAVLLLVGTFSFDLLVRRPACKAAGLELSAHLRSQFRLAGWNLVVAVGTAVLGLVVKIVTLTGTSALEFAHLYSAANVLFETQFGIVWLARIVLSCLLAVVLFAQHYDRVKIDSMALCVTGSVLSALLLLSLALTGHAAAAEGATLLIQVSMDALHLLAAGAWLGGLVPLALLFAWVKRNDQPQTLPLVQHATVRFSRLGFASVAIIAITGLFNAWYLVGGAPPLLGTAYGYLLLTKLALLVPLLGLATRNSFYLKPRLRALRNRQDGAIDLLVRLRRNVIAEFGLGAAILLVVAGMGVTPPARHVQPDWPFSIRLDWRTNIPRTAEARSQINKGGAAALAGIALLAFAVARRRQRQWLAGLGGTLFVSGSWLFANAISIDAYPTTYRRPSVAYHAISVANGRLLYQDSCAICHGIGGYGDGPAAEDQNPKPADLTAPHTALHTAGDLYWWLSHGIAETAMPGYRDSLSEEDRWDVINFLRALSDSDSARSLASVAEPKAWLVAPDFVYATQRGETKTLKDHRGGKAVLLVLFSLPESMNRLRQLDHSYSKLAAAGVEILLVPSNTNRSTDDVEVAVSNLPLVIDGSEEIFRTYSLFAYSFEHDRNSPEVFPSRHAEFLIDRQGYIRARWMPSEGTGWLKLENLLRQLEILSQEKSQAPAPDDHVH
jgi:putative copper resistance protein D